ncbi:hypothetical protein CEXT_767221 [Caerostris extrusa]|uniref:Uncharacterized protein n=1 Tax=Caerostris extrusa TaxID=172846 RepID=A0AAV4P5Y8_CAEEX|nr:hypothetical protein CEXT_767221 [Caerostris extrusa]
MSTGPNLCRSYQSRGLSSLQVDCSGSFTQRIINVLNVLAPSLMTLPGRDRFVREQGTICNSQSINLPSSPKVRLGSFGTLFDNDRWGISFVFMCVCLAKEMLVVLSLYKLPLLAVLLLDQMLRLVSFVLF